MKVKKKKKVEQPIPQMTFEWRGNIRYCRSPNGHEFPYQKKSKKFPNESEYAQCVRLTQNLPDDVDISKILKQEGKSNTWRGRTTSRLAGFWPGAWVTKIDKTEKIVAIVRKQLPEKGKYVVRVWKGEGRPPHDGEMDKDLWEKQVWDEDTKVVHGDAFAVPEPTTPELVFTVKPKADVGPVVTYTDADVKKRKRDRFGFKIGSDAAKINAALDTSGKTIVQIRKESGVENVKEHLGKLVKDGRVKTFVGKNSGKTFYKVKE